MIINIPNYVNNVIKGLEAHGYEAYVVGGAVRDMLMGITPDDWDVTTNALPSDVGRIFKRHYDTGIRHGTVTVISESKPVEVTTYRLEGKYKDNRHPESVIFADNIREDLKRRDFTINAIAYNEKTGIVDLYGGVEDIKNGIIRCVGNPYERFEEDALRIMRAIRFSVCLGFEIENNTKMAISEKKHNLKNISAERINAEISKMLLGRFDISPLFESGILELLFCINKNNKNYINKCERDLELKLSAMLVGKDEKNARQILNDLKYDNKTKHLVLSILRAFDEELYDTPYHIRKMLNKYGYDTYSRSIQLKRACGEKVNNIPILIKNELSNAYTVNMLDITGNDLLKMNISGKNIGEALEFLMEKVLKNPELNTYDQLISLLKNKCSDV